MIRDYTPVASNALKREAYDISENIEEWEKLMTSVFSPNRVETMVNKYQKVWEEASAAADVSFADDKLEMMGGVKVASIMANKLGFMMKEVVWMTIFVDRSSVGSIKERYRECTRVHIFQQARFISVERNGDS